MKKPATAAGMAAPPMRGSIDALKEVLSFARQILINLYNSRKCHAADTGPARIKTLSSENETLKRKLNELEKMMQEKL